MNYASHYQRLIERARNRTLVGYLERHHIIPKCMGGGNDGGNIVELTGGEHYVAHQLLVKMCPAVRGLALAALRGLKKTPEHIEKIARANRGRSRLKETCTPNREGA